MATFLGYSNFNGKNGDKFSADLLYDILEKNIAENYYKIRLYGYIRSWGYSGRGSYATFYINGKSAGGFSSITANQYSEVARRDITVNGDDEGNCVLDWSLSVDTSWTLGDASASGSLTLDKIPRKSSVSCANGNIESAVTINITRKSSSFTHTLRYDFGSLTNKTIVSKTTKTSYSWTLPTTFYAQIPNAKSGKVTLYCDTYNDDTLIGTSSTTFTAKTTESKCKPSVSATIVDTNQLSIDLTGNSNNLVKNVSNALVTTTATPKNSASISSIKVECADGKSGTGSSVTLKKVTSGDFTITIKDSRGYTNSTKVSKTLVNYVPLTLNYDFYRPEPTTGEIVMNVSGKYFNGSFGTVGNHLTVQYRYKESGGTYPEEYTTVTVNVTTSNTYSLELSLGTDFDYQKSYDFQIVAYDKITESSPINKTQHVSEGIPMLGLFKEYIEAFGHTLVETSDKGNVLHTGVDAYLPDGYYGLDMHNSDIIHANGIYMNDELSGREGIAFLKQGGDKDNADDFEFLQGRRGLLYYNNNGVFDARIGSIYSTPTNTNPSTIFGGEWTLVNKEFASYSVYKQDNTQFTPNPDVMESTGYYFGFTRNGHSITFHLQYNSAVTIADSSLVVGNIDFEAVGISRLINSVFCMTGFSDGGDAVVAHTLSYDGELGTRDVVDVAGNNSISSPLTIYWHHTEVIPMSYMLDEKCCRFDWKRTA